MKGIAIVCGVYYALLFPFALTAGLLWGNDSDGGAWAPFIALNVVLLLASAALTAIWVAERIDRKDQR